jgi:hypothetical protein
MEILIHNYLSRHYEIKTSDAGNDGIYYKEDLRRHKAPFYGEKLVKELVLVFDINKNEILIFINTWAKSINSAVDLEFYWKTQEEFLIPIALRIAAQSIGQDLVSVQPLSAPIGLLTHLDYQFSGNTPNKNGRIYDKPEEKERQSWFPIIEALGFNSTRGEKIKQLWKNQKIGISSRRKED